MAATAHLLPSTLSKRPDGTGHRDTASAADRRRGAYRPAPRYRPEAPAVIGVAPLLTAVPEPGPAPDDSGAFSAETAETEAPLTSEPPLADAAPLTSEPPLADAAPLTSEPTATGTAAGTDPSVE
ncbi:hypothetical protein [Streptomyces sp. TS71-3]|uniref:hypothetical protein n=1 Tax=Streptomyces sp. TS71-3 TaxID=2733862 RepID=UPI001B11821B|nr:hypothetical protein [Streptomyces sp. TS71-3]GHJ37574.1 hypothetical protein Sm713_31830 [Streptomyces sp. TS71-3]